MDEIKKTILHLWSMVKRPGIENLIRFLQESDFFEAPCSTKYHLAKRGGLAEHTLNVYRLLADKVNSFRTYIPNESVIICGLGHDLCKVNYYQEGGDPCNDAQYNFLCSLWAQKGRLVTEKPYELMKNLENEQFKRSISSPIASILIDWLKNRPQDPLPELPIVYSVKDQLPLGHGERSLSIIQNFILLTKEEKLAIRWHMGAWDLSDYSGRYSFNNAKEMTPLVALLSSADYEASNILEREENEN